MQYRILSAFWDGPNFHELGAVAEFPETIGAGLVRSGKAEAFTAPRPEPEPEPEPEPDPAPSRSRKSRRSP